jgi:hypothetical protein
MWMRYNGHNITMLRPPAGQPKYLLLPGRPPLSFEMRLGINAPPALRRCVGSPLILSTWPHRHWVLRKRVFKTSTRHTSSSPHSRPIYQLVLMPTSWPFAYLPDSIRSELVGQCSSGSRLDPHSSWYSGSESQLSIRSSVGQSRVASRARLSLLQTDKLTN